MRLSEATARARQVRARLAELEIARYGRSWSLEEIALGFVGDVGDLAKLIQAKAGVREVEDLDARFARELSDCLWAVLVLGACAAEPRKLLLQSRGLSQFDLLSSVGVQRGSAA